MHRLIHRNLPYVVVLKLLALHLVFKRQVRMFNLRSALVEMKIRASTPQVVGSKGFSYAALLCR